MDKHQQVFWTEINLRHKNKCPKKNNQHKRNYLLTSKQQNTVSNKVTILHGEQTKKNGKKKEFEIGISFISFTDDHSCR